MMSCLRPILAGNGDCFCIQFLFPPFDLGINQNDSLTYNEVSFKENYFADITLIGSERSYNRELTQKELSSNTSELTSIGSYEKCWKQEKGKWYMYKQANKLDHD